MKHPATVLLFSSVLAAQGQTTHELTVQGLTFDPPVINMVAGDSVHVVLPEPHTFTQVDESTWMNNENLPNGGFNFASGTHTVAIEFPGTYYYVCSPHASMGMKGQLIVSVNMAVPEAATALPPALFPAPASRQVTLTGVPAGAPVTVYDLSGQVWLRVPAAPGSTIDVSELPVGSYVVLAHDGTGNVLLNQRMTIAR